MNKKLIVLLSVVLLVGVLSLGVVAEDAQYGGTFVFGRGGDSVGLDPIQETDGESFKVAQQIYDTLVDYKLGTTDVIPT